MLALLRPALVAGLCVLAPSTVGARDPLDTFGSAPGSSSSGGGNGARAAPAPLRFVLQVGYDAGRFETGFYGTNDNDALIGLHLNEGPSAAVGFSWSPPNVPGGIQITIGYELSTVSDGGQRISWRAIPVETISYLQLDPIRLGIGISQLIQSSVESEGVYPPIDVEFDTSLGWVFELGWVAPMRDSARGAQTSLGIRYVHQKLKALGTEFDASAVGAVINFTL
jgi:hypothetical protein